MARFSNFDVHSKRLKRLTDDRARKRIYRALFAAGTLIETHAEVSITAGSVSGPNHVPSLPGQPPNADTRLLDGSIETTGSLQKMKVEVSSNAPYSDALENGTSRMIERPFMRPAVKAKRRKAHELIHKVVQDVIAGR